MLTTHLWKGNKVSNWNLLYYLITQNYLQTDFGINNSFIVWYFITIADNINSLFVKNIIHIALNQFIPCYTHTLKLSNTYSSFGLLHIFIVYYCYHIRNFKFSWCLLCYAVAAIKSIKPLITAQHLLGLTLEHVIQNVKKLKSLVKLCVPIAILRLDWFIWLQRAEFFFLLLLSMLGIVHFTF